MAWYQGPLIPAKRPAIPLRPQTNANAQDDIAILGFGFELENSLR